MIYPGEVNGMIARKGITHCERTSAETRAGRHALYGIQRPGVPCRTGTRRWIQPLNTMARRPCP